MNIRSFLVAVVLALVCAEAIADGRAQPAARERLLAGEIVAREVSSEGGGGSARMQILVQAPAQAVWEVIVSCDLAFRFVAGLRSCEVLEQHASRALVHQVVDEGWLMPRYDFVFESLRSPFERIEVALVKGNLDILQGYWSFSETAAGTVVEHELRVRPSAPVPRFLVRRNLERTMPDMLACVRALAGGSGTPEQERSDLARCAGRAAVPG